MITVNNAPSPLSEKSVKRLARVAWEINCDPDASPEDREYAANIRMTLWDQETLRRIAAHDTNTTTMPVVGTDAEIARQSAMWRQRCVGHNS